MFSGVQLWWFFVTSYSYFTASESAIKLTAKLKDVKLEAKRDTKDTNCWNFWDVHVVGDLTPEKLSDYKHCRFLEKYFSDCRWVLC